MGLIETPADRDAFYALIKEVGSLKETVAILNKTLENLRMDLAVDRNVRR